MILKLRKLPVCATRADPRSEKIVAEKNSEIRVNNSHFAIY